MSIKRSGRLAWVGAGVLVLGLVGWAALRKGNARNRSAGGVA